MYWERLVKLWSVNNSYHMIFRIPMYLYYFINNIFIFYICIYIILILIDCMIWQMLYTLHYTTDLFHICKIQSNIIKDEDEDIQKSIDFWKVPSLCPFLLLVRATCEQRWVWSSLHYACKLVSYLRENSSVLPLSIHCMDKIQSA